jgi:uncharacterized membrane protein
MRKTLEGIGILALAALFWMTHRAITGPNHLPDKIPTHFDAAGRPNAWGSSASLFLLPAVGLLIYLAITVVSRFPAAFNFPVRVTAKNRLRLEALAMQMITLLKVELSCLFLWIQWSTIDAARHQALGLPMLLVPVSLLAIFGTVIGHILAMRQAVP